MRSRTLWLSTILGLCFVCTVVVIVARLRQPDRGHEGERHANLSDERAEARDAVVGGQDPATDTTATTNDRPSQKGIVSGYLFVDLQYIPQPYVVQYEDDYIKVSGHALQHLPGPNTEPVPDELPELRDLATYTT